jgi:Ceramidase
MPSSPTFTPTAATLRAPLAPRLFALAALLIALALLAAGPIGLPDGYHQFADRSTWLGIPHALDVLTNLPFLFAGLWGLARLRGVAGHAAWRVFFAAVALTAFGSACYHWAPDDFTLLFDRLPIAWACAAFCCAFVAERIDARAAQPAVLIALLLFGTAASVYAYLSPTGDLRAYLLLQVWPLALVPLFIAWLPRRGSGLATPNWCVPLVLYAVAKAFEVADHAILDLTGVLSGHNLKHLAAAAAAAWLAWAMRDLTRDLRSASRAG